MIFKWYWWLPIPYWLSLALALASLTLWVNVIISEHVLRCDCLWMILNYEVILGP